ncbi:hypothetical protein CF326_g8596 [Tilletia indica]|nr:hypothetical protein CF326_g8596 [Tilletia indica]
MEGRGHPPVRCRCRLHRSLSSSTASRSQLVANTTVGERVSSSRPGSGVSGLHGGLDVTVAVLVFYTTPTLSMLGVCPRLTYRRRDHTRLLTIPSSRFPPYLIDSQRQDTDDAGIIVGIVVMCFIKKTTAMGYLFQG